MKFTIDTSNLGMDCMLGSSVGQVWQSGARVNALTFAIAVTFVCGAYPMSAQSQHTAIVPDTIAGRATGTSVSQPTTHTYVISGGTQSGGNLFESFYGFSLASGDTVAWTSADATGIKRVINRVTGGGASYIDGKLDTSALPNADFYFINPAGIFIGPDASTNIPGSIYLATSSGLRFADGSSYLATTPNGSAFSAAPPEAFGFVGTQADIRLAGDAGGSSPTFGNSSGLSLIAGNITISNVYALPAAIPPATTLTAVGQYSGELDLNALRDNEFTSGSVSVVNSSILFSSAGSMLPGFAMAAGDIRLQNSIIQSAVSAGPFAPSSGIQIYGNTLTLDASEISIASYGTQNSGDIDVHAGSVTLKNDSGIGAVTVGEGPSASLSIQTGQLSIDDSLILSTTIGAGHGGAIDIAASEGIRLTNGGSVQAAAESSGDAGNIKVASPSLSIDGASPTRGSKFQSGLLTGSSQTATGKAGDIFVKTEHLDITGTGGIGAETYAGAGGNITIEAGDITMASLGVISASTYGSGAAGNIDLTADSLSLQEAHILANTFGDGAGGDISLNVNRDLSLTQGGFVEVDASAGGNAGDIRIKTANLLISGHSALLNPDFFSGIAADSFQAATGNAGSISISADDVSMRDGGTIEAQTFSGSGGQIDIEAGTVTLASQAQILTETLGRGNASDLKISGNTLTIDDAGIDAGSFGSGKGGTVVLSLVDRIDLINGGEVLAQAGDAGPGGAIDVQTGTLHIGGTSPTNGSQFLSGLDSSSTEPATGAAGDVSVNTGTVEIDDGGTVEAVTHAGPGGKIDIVADSLRLTGDGSVSTVTSGSGDAGNLTITVGSLDADGGFIEAGSAGSGHGGAIAIDARDDIRLSDSATIQSAAEADGDGGTITITAKTVSLSSESIIDVGASDSGNGGDLMITDNAFSADNSVVSAGSLGAGNGGNIEIRSSGGLSLINDAVVESVGQAAGRSGDIDLTATSLLISGGFIQTDSNNENSSGLVLFHAPTITMDHGFITSANTWLGPAGTISIFSNQLTISNSSVISTSAASGPAGDIDMAFSPGGILKIGNPDAPSNIATSSDSNTGGRINIHGGYSVIMDGAQIQALGPGNKALIDIQAGSVILSEDTWNIIAYDGTLNLEATVFDANKPFMPPLPAYIDAAKIMKGQCVGRKTSGRASTFTALPLGPYVIPRCNGLEAAALE